MTVLVWLILAHIIADFYLQPTSWVQARQARGLKAGALYWHTLVHAGAAAVALCISAALGQVSWSFNLVWVVLIISLGNWLIDAVKMRFTANARNLLIDQLAHVIVIVGAWAWLTGLWPFVHIWTLGFLLQRDHLIILAAYLLLAKPVSIFTASVLSRQAQALAQHNQASGLIEAGRMIGYVERWLILSFVLTGQFIGIGFLLAAKSIFRFGDLSQAHERRLTEYMLLGTLVSFASAMAIAGLCVYLTG